LLNLLKRFKAAWIGFRHPEAVQIKDFLTGALNRQTFICAAQRELSRAERGVNQSLSLAFFDMDGLKKLNDIQGHKAGDRYLKKFVATALTQIRPYDLLARLAGDEFILLTPGSAEAAEEISKRIYRLFPYFSWGISVWSPGKSLNSLIDQADGRMYQMKKSLKK
jgi:diguanylate cyclase (GGDEF)-like protein